MIINFTPFIKDAEEYPPIPCKEYIPDWIKNLNYSNNSFQSLNKCPPIIDFITSGYYIRSAESYKFKRYVKNNEEEIDVIGNIVKDLQTQEGNLSIKTLGYHTFDQVPLSTNNIKKAVWKFNQWWSFATPPGYSMLVISPFYHNLDFQIFPTILDTDSNFNVPQGLSAMSVYNSFEEKSWEVKKGDIIAQIIPIKREEWESNFQSYLPENYNIMIDKTLQNYKNHRIKKQFK